MRRQIYRIVMAAVDHRRVVDNDNNSFKVIDRGIISFATALLVGSVNDCLRKFKD